MSSFKKRKKEKQFILIAEIAIFVFIVLSLLGISKYWASYFNSPRTKAAERKVVNLQEFTGVIERMHIDNFENHTTRDEYFLNVSSSKRLKVKFIDNVPNVISQSTVKLKGTVQNNTLNVNMQDNSSTGNSSNYFVIDTPRNQILEEWEGEIKTRPVIKKKLAVVLIKFDDEEPFFSIDDVRRSIFTYASSVREYYKANSYNRLLLQGAKNFDGDIYGWYKLDLPENERDTVDDVYVWRRKVIDILIKEEKVKLNSYDNFIIILPNPLVNPQDVKSKYNLERGGVNLNEFSFVFPSKYDDLSVIAVHELGHGLGLDHANAYVCKKGVTRVDLGQICISKEYHDPFDAMGGLDPSAIGDTMGLTNLNAPHKEMLNFFKPDNIMTIENATQNKIYDILPLDQTTNGVQVLKVYRPVSKDYLYIEFRRAMGFDAKVMDEYYNGVFLHLVGNPDDINIGIQGEDVHSGSKLKRTKLIDTHIETPTYLDAALKSNESFYDSTNKIYIKTITTSQYGATVEVSYE